jgi:hypothetical protein
MITIGLNRALLISRFSVKIFSSSMADSLRKRGRVEGRVLREGEGGEMTQTLYAHMNKKEKEMDREKGKDLCSSHIVTSVSVLSDSHGPRTTIIKSIENLNDMWLIIGGNFPSRSGFPPKTKPLSLSKHFTNSFLLKSCF